MQEIINAILLGIIQGLGEFLPISSSGHLVIAHAMGINIVENTLALDVALHFGTLIAVITYFWKAIFSFMRRFFYKVSLLFNKRKGELKWFIRAKEYKILVLIVIATIPGALIGYFGEDWVEKNTRSILLVAGALVFYGVLLMIADELNEKMVKRYKVEEEKRKKAGNHRGLSLVKMWRAFLIGLSQALAIIPGTSRSGITITTAMLLGFKRAEAARFSFILSIPIIAGAAMVKLPALFKSEIDLVPVILSILISFLTGFLAIKYMIYYVSTKNYKIFGYYRIGLAIIIILFVLFKG